MLNNVFLFILLMIAVYLDVYYHKIPNTLTIPAILIGSILAIMTHGLNGLRNSVIGSLLGLIILIAPFLFGGMGGGDVKLMAAIGALKGWKFVLLTTIYSGLVGGIIIIIILIKQKKLMITLKRVFAIILKPIMFVLTLTFENKKLNQFNDWLLGSQINWEKQYIPYGVAIGIGAIMALLI